MKTDGKSRFRAGARVCSLIIIVVLLIAAVGAVVLARRRGGIVQTQPAQPLDRPRPLGTGTMAEAVGIMLPPGSGLTEEEPQEQRGGW